MCMFCLYSSTDWPAIFTHWPINSVLEQVQRSCWAQRICKSAHMTALWGEQSRNWAARGPFFMAKRGCFPVHVHGPSVKSLRKPCQQVWRPHGFDNLKQSWDPKLRAKSERMGQALGIHPCDSYLQMQEHSAWQNNQQMVFTYMHTVSSPWNMVPCLSKTFSWGQFC